MAAHPLPPGPWLRFALYFNGPDRQFQSDVWYKVNTAGTVANAATVLADFVTLVTTYWLPTLSSNITLYAVKLYANNGTFTVSYVNYPEVAGGAIDQEMPTEVTLIGALKADIATRQANGRIFISGITGDAINGDYPSTAAVTWVNELLNQLALFVESAAWEFTLSIWDRVTAALHNVITSGVSAVIGSLRRRRPRV